MRSFSRSVLACSINTISDRDMVGVLNSTDRQADGVLTLSSKGMPQLLHSFSYNDLNLDLISSAGRPSHLGTQTVESNMHT